MGREDVRTGEPGPCQGPVPTHSPPEWNGPGHRGRKWRVATAALRPLGPLTATPGLLLQQRPQDPPLQGTQLPKPAKLLCQLRVSQRQVHPEGYPVTRVKA